MSQHYYGRPLTVTVENGQLAIAIGVHTLAHAVSYSDWANPWCDEHNDYIRTFAITDAEAFANDVRRAVLDEREDGSSPLTDFLDKASEAALDDGSEACEYEQHIKHGETAPTETWASSPQEPR
jgi:type IV secretory pathway VirB4 component